MTQSTDERWVNMRAAVIDALAARNLQIFSNVHGVSLVPIRKSGPADERVERLMELVESYGEACAAEQRANFRVGHESQAVHTRHDLPAMLGAVEQSARALLSASQDDAKQEALRFHEQLLQTLRL